MAPAPPRGDMRLTIPAAAPYHTVAAELAGRFAEFAGAHEQAAHALAREVETSIAAIAGETPDVPVLLVMLTEPREIRVTLNAGSTKTLTCPLPD